MHLHPYLTRSKEKDHTIKAEETEDIYLIKYKSLKIDNTRIHLEGFPCAAAAAKSLQSCPTLCDHIDGSPPGSLVPGILQAGTLEWVAISFPVHESEKPK